MAGKSLPPGFRFHPTDVELVLYYLKRKVMGKKQYEAIEEVNIYKFSPWDLPDKSCLKSKDLEWFFFCPREKKYASGVRVKRATENGYWKTTGKDRTIRCNDRTVGAVKTLVFHLGHAPQGQRTDWVIHEYRILDDELAAAGLQDAYVLCKVFKKNGPGPKNGAQYGAPFNEADWADDDCDDAEKHAISLAPDGPSPLTLMQSEHESFPFQGGLFALGVTSLLPLPEDPSPSAVGAASELVVDEIDNDIVRLRALFTDEDTLPSNGNGIAQDDLSGKRHNYSLPSDGNEIYSGLRDLDGWGQMHEGILDFSDLQNDEYFLSDMLPQDNSAYIELDDILPPLDCSDGITRADQLSHEISGIPGTGNIQQHYSGGDDCLDVLPMVDHWLDQLPNASYDLDFAFGQPDGYPANDVERGRCDDNQ